MAINHPYQMSSRRGLACVAASFVAFAISTAAQAQTARPRVPIDQGPQIAPSVTEVSRTPYQEYAYSQACTLGAICTVNFKKVPSSYRLELKNVSCYISGVSEAAAVSRSLRVPYLKYAQLLVLNSSDAIMSASTMVPRSPNAWNVFPRNWSANHAIAVYARATQHFQVYVSPLFPENRVSFLGCHISGQLVKLQ